jgi:hypothetical protein
MIGKDLEGNSSSLIEVLSWHVPGGSEQLQKTSVIVAGVPADIRTEHLWNTCLDRYRFLHVNTISVFRFRKKNKEFLDKLSDCQLVNTNSDPRI